MESSDPSEQPFLPQKEYFTHTDWFVVNTAAGDTSVQSRSALEELCRNYWYPLYAFVRRQGHSPEDAQDLTQDFFARLLEKKYLRLANPERGKFRTFLLSSLKHFLVNEWEKSRAAKRGGGQVISWDQQSAESRYLMEPRDDVTAEKLYERRWATALLEKVMGHLRDEYSAGGKLELFEQLKVFVGGEKGDVSYAEAAKQLGKSEGAVKVAIHRLRQRHSELLHDEVAQTVPNPEELEDELRYLATLLEG